MNKIYYIFWDHDIYVHGRYELAYSGSEGFWVKKPTNKKIAAYMLKKYPQWENEIMNGLNRVFDENSIVWDIEEWERIDEC